MFQPTLQTKANGMPVISSSELDVLGERMLADFSPLAPIIPQEVDIDRFLLKHLGMKQDFHYLSHCGVYLGMTVFQTTHRLPVYNPALKRITTGQYVANNGEGPHFTAQSASGKWAYIRLHNSSNYYDIGTRNDKGGLWLARPNGSDKGIFVSTAGKVAISSDLSKVTNDVPNELTVSGTSSFTSPNIPVHIKRSTTFPAIGYFGGDDANTIYGYIGFRDANKPAWCKTDGSTVYHFLHTGNSGISEYAVKINDTTAHFVRDWGNHSGTLGSVARAGRSSIGMVNLPTSTDNPNN